MPFRLMVLISSLLTAVAVQADTTATAEDGRKVILRDNGTWSWAADVESETDPVAVLTLEKRKELANGCRLGLRLQNNLTTPIQSLVIRLTAYKGADIAFETVSRGYTFIKPTKSQYHEVTFRDIRCKEITSVEVFAGRSCRAGDLTKYLATADDCTNLFRVPPSDLMPIVRRPVDD